MDDAYTWGQIAAANAVSDVYAMGGRPLWALNLVGWPKDKLPLTLLAEVLKGGANIASKAKMAVVGGHSVDDPEPKYGMCVVGSVPKEKIMTMDKARPGDRLVLTKPIGTGIITTALKADRAPADAIEAAVRSMITLNDKAASECRDAGVQACTDVTGFGLLGHLHRMLKASGAAAELCAAAIPRLPSTQRLTQQGFVPGGTKRNLVSIAKYLSYEVDESTQLICNDAQTSGGLLAACGNDLITGHVIGRVTDGKAGHIHVKP